MSIDDRGPNLDADRLIPGRRPVRIDVPPGLSQAQEKEYLGVSS